MTSPKISNKRKQTCTDNTKYIDNNNAKRRLIYDNAKRQTKYAQQSEQQKEEANAKRQLKCNAQKWALLLHPIAYLQHIKF